MKIGILALQGAIQDHEGPFRRLGVETVLVRTPADLEGLDALLLPGGESTVMSMFLKSYGLDLAIRGHAARGMGIFGLCAGAILLCEKVDGREGALGLLPANARRNAYGRQLASFEEELQSPIGPFHGIFIRAPKLESLGAQVLARRANGDAALLRFGRVLAATFHPELTGDDRIHRYFVDMVAQGTPCSLR